jgi:hypothetical protein
MGHIYSADVKRRAVLRELRFRKEVFARKVKAGTMSPHQASEEIAVFEQIANDYADIAERERLL